jgi:hypothetical protein
MGLLDPFGHLKHKLWPKERPWVKIVIWLPTIKSEESTRFFIMKVSCNIPLESSWQGLKLFFKPHRNQRYAHEVMGPQSCKNPNFGNLEVPGQNAIWMWASWRSTKYIIRGKVVASPKSGPWWVLWVQICPWWVLTPKVPKLCTNQLVVWFVQICVSD